MVDAMRAPKERSLFTYLVYGYITIYAALLGLDMIQRGSIVLWNTLYVGVVGFLWIVIARRFAAQKLANRHPH